MVKEMFGKKDEYDGFGGYDESNNYGYNPGTSTDELKSIFQPYLEEGEKILWSMCNGDAYAQSPAESDKFKGAVKGVKNAHTIIIIVVIIAFLLLIFGGAIAALIGTVLFVSAGRMINVIKFLLIGTVIALIIWALKSETRNNMCYAITDRRIITYGYSQFNEIRFENIQKTKAVISRENRGSIVTNGLPLVFIMPGVEDPYRVKYLLDSAIEEYKRDHSQW